MTAQTLLSVLAAHGLRVRVAGTHLAVHPAAALTPELRTLITTHRDMLLSALKGSDSRSADEDAIDARRLVFLQQIVAAGRGPIPPLCYRPDRPCAPGRCTSCGEPFVEGDTSFGRCPLCGEAARRAVAHCQSGNVP